MARGPPLEPHPSAPLEEAVGAAGPVRLERSGQRLRCPTRKIVARSDSEACQLPGSAVSQAAVQDQRHTPPVLSQGLERQAGASGPFGQAGLVIERTKQSLRAPEPGRGERHAIVGREHLEASDGHVE